MFWAQLRLLFEVNLNLSIIYPIVVAIVVVVVVIFIVVVAM